MNESTVKGLIEVFESNNIFIKFDSDDDVNVMDYILDSLHFIEIAVSIEEKLNISFLPEDLVFSNFTSFKKLCVLIEKYLK